MSDDISVAAHGVNHLIEVRHVTRRYQEYALSSRALQRLQYNGAALVSGEGFNLVLFACNQGLRTHLFGEMLKIHFVQRFGESVRIVEDNDSVAHGNPAEYNAGALRPRSGNRVIRRIVSKHQYIKVVNRDTFDDSAFAL